MTIPEGVTSIGENGFCEYIDFTIYASFPTRMVVGDEVESHIVEKGYEKKYAGRRCAVFRIDHNDQENPVSLGWLEKNFEHKDGRLYLEGHASFGTVVTVEYEGSAIAIYLESNTFEVMKGDYSENSLEIWGKEFERKV